MVIIDGTSVGVEKVNAWFLPTLENRSTGLSKHKDGNKRSATFRGQGSAKQNLRDAALLSYVL
jgi:hypothetical protein